MDYFVICVQMHVLVLVAHLVYHAEHTYGEEPFVHSYLTMMYEFSSMFATYHPITLISQALLA